MPTFPYVQNKKLPSDLENVENGKLDTRSLASLSIGVIDKNSWDTYGHKGYPGNYPIWQGHKLAVAAMELMVKAAAVDKIDLRVQGGYRPYEEQFTTFHKRYTDKRPNEKKWNKQAKAGRQGIRVGRLDEFAKDFKGTKYWLKTGDESPVSVPGHSNHGLGIAFDLQYGFNKNLPNEWIY
jgi:LAS superfamily LD-carboxypeptidase LdcB